MATPPKRAKKAVSKPKPKEKSKGKENQAQAQALPAREKATKVVRSVAKPAQVSGTEKTKASAPSKKLVTKKRARETDHKDVKVPKAPKATTATTVTHPVSRNLAPLQEASKAKKAKTRDDSDASGVTVVAPTRTVVTTAPVSRPASRPVISHLTPPTPTPTSTTTLHHKYLHHPTIMNNNNNMTTTTNANANANANTGSHALPAVGGLFRLPPSVAQMRHRVAAALDSPLPGPSRSASVRAPPRPSVVAGANANGTAKATATAATTTTTTTSTAHATAAFQDLLREHEDLAGRYKALANAKIKEVDELYRQQADQMEKHGGVSDELLTTMKRELERLTQKTASLQELREDLDRLRNENLALKEGVLQSEARNAELEQESVNFHRRAQEAEQRARAAEACGEAALVEAERYRAEAEAAHAPKEGEGEYVGALALLTGLVAGPGRMGNGIAYTDVASGLSFELLQGATSDVTEGMELDDRDGAREMTYVPVQLGTCAGTFPEFLTEEVTFATSQMPGFLLKMLPGLLQARREATRS